MKTNSILRRMPLVLAATLFLSLTAMLAPGGASAQAPERSGKQVVDAICGSCHATGAKGALEFAKAALRERGVEVNWTSSFSRRSALQQRLIEMEADTEAATLSVLHAAWLNDMKLPNNLESSVCKAKGGEVSRTIPQAAMELLGGMSASHDHLVEKFLRDGRISDIYEGTGQIQRLIIAREILGYSSEELN